MTKAVWAEVYADLSSDRLGLVGSLLARAEAHVLRLAAVYALLDTQRTIGVEHLTAALALWQYVEASVMTVFGDATGDPDADTMLQAVRNTELTDTQISDLFGRHRSQARLDHAKLLLQSAGLIHSVLAKDGSGRPKRIWRPGRGSSEG